MTDKETKSMSEELVDVEKKWFYVRNGNRLGPESEKGILDLITEGKIVPDTSVWGGVGDWCAARESAIGYLFRDHKDGPPPVAARDVNNRFVLLALVSSFLTLPAAGIVYAWFISVGSEVPIAALWAIPFGFGLQITLCEWDAKKLKASGFVPPNDFWTLFAPIYFYKRGNVVGAKRFYALLWMLALVVGAIATLGAPEAFNQQKLAAASVSVVTDILKENAGDNAPKCSSVDSCKKLNESNYSARAILSDGRTIPINIEDRNDKIYVTISQADMLKYSFQ